MSFPVHDISGLGDVAPGNRLFGAWLSDGLSGAPFKEAPISAAGELRSALAGAGEGDSPEAAPYLDSAAFRSWIEESGADCPGSADRQILAANLRRLADGTATVVVTGQQPGFMGGPLYSLYKIATTVALARRRSAAGLPTVPVFWAGDDDDDLTEALSPVVWDRDSSSLLRGGTVSSGRSRRTHRPLVGAMSSREFSQESSRWLAACAAGLEPSLVADLADLWSRAVAEDWPWSRLMRSAYLLLFAGEGLVVVSGNEPGLHRTAEPIYRQIAGRRQELVAAARQQGECLVGAGWHAQLSERSLTHHLYVEKDGGRRPLAIDPLAVEPGRLRPGVMLRCLIQDWLLRPAAVVVGPAELAYLRMLDPLYEVLGIHRSPLVPRLFSWLAPSSLDRKSLVEDPSPEGHGSEDALRWSRELSGSLEDKLVELMVSKLDLTADRARHLAAGRVRRWQPGVGAMLEAEIRRLFRERPPRQPAWVFPENGRQERHFATIGAAAIWGRDLLAAVGQAADRHLDAGLSGNWRQFMIEVPEPKA